MGWVDPRVMDWVEFFQILLGLLELGRMLNLKKLVQTLQKFIVGLLHTNIIQSVTDSDIDQKSSN